MDVEKEDKPLEGWRLFSLTKDIKLQGSHSTIWEGLKLTAECEVRKNIAVATGLDEAVDVVEQFIGAQARAVNHLREGSCFCGIYVVKDNSTHSYWVSAIEENIPHVEAKVHAYGVCVEGELGVYRCEHVAIDYLNIMAVPCNNCHTLPSEYFKMKEIGDYPRRYGNEGKTGQLCAYCITKLPVVSSNYVRWDVLGRALELNYPGIPVNLEPLYSGNNPFPEEYPLSVGTLEALEKMKFVPRGSDLSGFSTNIG